MYTKKVIRQEWKSVAPLQWRPDNVKCFDCVKSTRHVPGNESSPRRLEVCSGIGEHMFTGNVDLPDGGVALWEVEKTDVTCLRDVSLEGVEMCCHGITGCEICKVVLSRTRYRSIEVTDTFLDQFCYIQHVVSKKYITVTGKSVRLAPLHDRNAAMFNRDYYSGYSNGEPVRIAMFSTYANCRPSSTFLCATKDDIFVQQHTDDRNAITNTSLSGTDPRVFINHEISPGYHVFELALERDNYIAFSSTGLTVKYVPSEYRQIDTDIQFRVRFPDTCIV